MKKLNRFNSTGTENKKVTKKNSLILEHGLVIGDSVKAKRSFERTFGYPKDSKKYSGKLKSLMETSQHGTTISGSYDMATVETKNGIETINAVWLELDNTK